MMFSSRRSRNRHSANPNPKLHTPHLRRKISPHDGRTHQGPFLPSLASALGGGPPPPPPPAPKDGGGSHAAMAAAMNHSLLSASSAAAAHPHMAAAAAAAAGFPGMPPAAAAMLSPELLQRHQMELQRFHEMSKMSSLFGQHQQQARKPSLDLKYLLVIASQSHFSKCSRKISI